MYWVQECPDLRLMPLVTKRGHRSSSHQRTQVAGCNSTIQSHHLNRHRRWAFPVSSRHSFRETGHVHCLPIGNRSGDDWLLGTGYWELSRNQGPSDGRCEAPGRPIGLHGAFPSENQPNLVLSSPGHRHVEWKLRWNKQCRPTQFEWC